MKPFTLSYQPASQIHFSRWNSSEVHVSFDCSYLKVPIILFNFSVLHSVYFYFWSLFKIYFSSLSQPGTVVGVTRKDKEVHRKWGKASQIKKNMNSYLTECLSANTESIKRTIFKSLKIVASAQVILACEHTIIWSNSRWKFKSVP